MFMASPEIVTMLLDHGVDERLEDQAGNDPFAFACISNQLDNVKCWLKRFPDWDLERRNKIVGGVALSHAVFMGPNRLKLVRYLVETAGASLETVAHNGGSVLTALCASEDADVDALRYILQQSSSKVINKRLNATTMKWYSIQKAVKVAHRIGLANLGVVRLLSSESGATALHLAARRGDIEVVELLLSSGADPSFRNDLGQDAGAMCKSFPELRGVLEKRERMMELRGTGKKMGAVEVLGRRISTATTIQHEMWLISLENLLMLYGGEKGNRRVMDVHQELKRRDLLTPWCDAPADAEIIFVSAHSTL